MIIYFSGTGNSRCAAERLSKGTGMDCFDMGKSIKSGIPMDPFEGDVIFSTPTYAWRIPRMVETWIRDNPCLGGKRAWFVMTCGNDTGDAGRYLERLCRETGMEYMGCLTVVMPENYIAMFDVPDREEAEETVRAAEPVIDLAAGCIKEGRPFEKKKAGLADKIKSGIVNDLFYPVFVKDISFRAGEGCTSCGLCSEVCVLNNITIKDGRPSWGGRCTHCMACICRCPAEAIEYGRKSSGKPRYTCPF